MMKKIIVSPSILSADFANLERDIKRVEEAGADWIHVDVMDGHFVPNITIGVPVVKSIRKITKLPLDVHLMIDNPGKYIEDFANAGADIITFHYEALAGENSTNITISGTQAFHLEEDNSSMVPVGVQITDLIEKIHSLGKKAGMSIKPKTSPDEVIQYLKYLDLLLVMTVEPGFGGQAFMSDCPEKIRTIAHNSTSDLIIQVDGGINNITGKICKDFGANSLVAGNYIYGADDIQAAISSLKM